MQQISESIDHKEMSDGFRILYFVLEVFPLFERDIFGVYLTPQYKLNSAIVQ